VDGGGADEDEITVRRKTTIHRAHRETQSSQRNTELTGKTQYGPT
jgi:hypothetical protein